MQAIKTPRNFQTTSARHLNGLRELGITTQQLSEEFGVSCSSVALWLKNNKAPYWTKVASEGLKRRMGKQDPTKLMLLKVPQEHLKTVEALIKGLEITCKIID